MRPLKGKKKQHTVFLCQLAESQVRSKISQAIEQLRTQGMIPEGIKLLEKFNIESEPAPEYLCSIIHKLLDNKDLKDALHLANEVVAQLVLILEQAYRIVYPDTLNSLEDTK